MTHRTSTVAAAATASQAALVHDHVDFQPSGTGWEGAPELPTPGELLADRHGDLPVNPVDRPWSSKHSYLGAQYRVLRCEGLEGLRYSVSCVRQQPGMKDDQNTCVYVSAHVRGYLMTRLGPICRVAFSARRAEKRIKWQHSKRLTPGTLVAVSTAEDRFRKICKVAVVAQRPYVGGLDQNPPEIDIFWADIEEAVIDSGEELIMVESRNGYFEAVRHALVGLQHAAKTSSPLDKYVVSCDKSDQETDFVGGLSPLNLSSLIHHIPQETGDQPSTDPALLHSLKASLVEQGAGITDIQDYTTLDSSQLAALRRILTKEIAIIQGPPGTGKTFTSVSALRVMVDNRPQHKGPPIIVAAQTNHALDQLLLLCQDAGAKVLRVGGRTSNERMKKRTVYSLRQRCKMNLAADKEFRALERERSANIKALEGLVGGMFGEDILQPEQLRQAGIITDAQYTSLMDEVEWEGDGTDSPISVWLGDQQIPTSQQEDLVFHDEEDNEETADCEVDLDLDNLAADDDDDDRIRGTFISFSQRWTGRAPSMGQWQQRCEEILKSESDLWKVTGLRGGVYLLMLSKFRALQEGRIRTLLKEATLRAKAMKADKWIRDLGIVSQQSISIVGCTTTGLTKYRGFLAAMEPRTVLIEEAAETREANVTSALYPSVQQLILVGDHQQLAPHCDIQQLGEEPWNLNVSMFERLVNMGVPYQMLNRQRRMAPEIRYIVGKFYPELMDHPLVTDPLQRPPVPGMGERRSWFFTHNWPEESDVDGSKSNQLEAEMVTKFVAYLVSNGVKMQQITVLTYYNGQRKMLIRMFRRHGLVSETFFNIFTVDSYQGEENDVVILSLVRSPQAGKKFAIGFLNNRNRATVAVSRARRGFFLFGNKDNLLNTQWAESYVLWANIWNGFAEQNRVAMSKGLPLVCRNHRNEVWCKEPDDFTRYAGGCDVDCKGQLPCGHDCQLKCHPMDHADLPCVMACSLTLNCGHKCGGRCSEVCFCDCPAFRVQAWHPAVTRSEDVASSQSRTQTPTNAFTHANTNWQSFTRNIAQHDENAYQMQIAARGPAVPNNDLGPNNQPGPTHHPIREKWRQTTMRNGRRGSAAHGTPKTRRQTPHSDPTTNKAPPRSEPNEQQVINRTPKLPADPVPEARLDYGFEAEVLGAFSPLVPSAQSPTTAGIVAVKEDDVDEDADEWLIGF